MPSTGSRVESCGGRRSQDRRVLRLSEHFSGIHRMYSQIMHLGQSQSHEVESNQAGLAIENSLKDVDSRGPRGAMLSKWRHELISPLLQAMLNYISRYLRIIPYPQYIPWGSYLRYLRLTIRIKPGSPGNYPSDPTFVSWPSCETPEVDFLIGV